MRSRSIAFLLIDNGGKKFVKRFHSRISIGRDRLQCDFGLVDDDGPPCQFDIVRYKDTYKLFDMSGNGTLVDGSLVEEADLIVGKSIIKAGSVCFSVIEHDAHSMSTTPVPSIESFSDDERRRLVMLVDTGKGEKKYPLGLFPISVGRDEGCTVKLDDNSVSGRHLEVGTSRDGKGFVLKDLETTNGTWIGDIFFRKDEVDIYAGMEAGIGPYKIKFSYEGSDTDPEPFHGIVYADGSMDKVIRYVKSVARSVRPVLITGETGSGKGMVANALHRESGRTGGMVDVRLNTLAESLVESTLFGHVKGAFTGAYKDKAGEFELAHNGTLFLDEIGELDLKLQVKLLQAIETKKIMRVGDTRERDVDFRLVCATNRDLKKEVEEGRFREDLYHRINVLRIHVPPLRERPGDIPVLVKDAGSSSDSPVRCSSEAYSELLRYNWPGNARELYNTIENAISRLGSERMIKPEHLDFSSGVVTDGLKSMVRDYERKVMAAALELSNNNQTEAAKKLRLSRTTFRSKAQALGLILDDED